MPLNHMLKKYYTQSEEQDDLISIGTIGLIKGISTFKPEKGARLATYAARCVENEILMYFRSRKKLQGEVSLSDSIETDQDGNDLMLMDVVGVDDTMLSDLQDREDSVLVRRLVRECLTDREREIVTLRYGSAKSQKNSASQEAMSPASKSGRWKSSKKPSASTADLLQFRAAAGIIRLKILPVGRTVPCTISALTLAEQTSRARL